MSFWVGVPYAKTTTEHKPRVESVSIDDAYIYTFAPCNIAYCCGAEITFFAIAIISLCLLCACAETYQKRD